MVRKKKDVSGIIRFTQVKPGTNVVFNIMMCVLCLVCIVPILLVVAISFSAETSLQEHGYRLLPKALSIDGYAFLFQKQGTMLRALGISVLITVAGTVLGVTLNGLMGYVLSRKEYKLQKFFVWFVFIPMIFSGGLVASYFVVAQFL